PRGRGLDRGADPRRPPALRARGRGRATRARPTRRWELGLARREGPPPRRHAAAAARGRRAAPARQGRLRRPALQDRVHLRRLAALRALEARAPHRDSHRAERAPAAAPAALRLAPAVAGPRAPRTALIRRAGQTARSSLCQSFWSGARK